MASRSRNGGRHIDNQLSLGYLYVDLTSGNRHARRRAKALIELDAGGHPRYRAKYAETRPRKKSYRGKKP